MKLESSAPYLRSLPLQPVLRQINVSPIQVIWINQLNKEALITGSEMSGCGLV
jgi:hypothetical protein